jgi:hypothetical protein
VLALSARQRIRQRRAASEMWIHVVRPCVMVLAAVIGFSTLSAFRWRLLVAALQTSFVIFDMIVLPVARRHATLYTNLMIALSLLISSVSPSNAWLLHGSAFISAHILLVGYVMVLYAAGDGLIEGFYVVDVVQWTGHSTTYPDVKGAALDSLRTFEMACEASFVLHALPLLLVHLDLRGDASALAAAYRGRGLRSHCWSVGSAFVIPIVYQVLVTLAYGTLDVAMETLYRIKPRNLPTLLAAGFPANLVVAILCFRRVLQAADTAARAATQRTKRQ